MQITVHHYPSVASTNTTAKDYLVLGAEEGTVIIADEQTAGRGQFGRVWQSLNGNLHCSLILKPPVRLEPFYPELAMVAAGALQKALQEIIPDLPVTLKAPNDLLIDGKKVAGILIEVESGALIIGIGLNIKKAPEGLDQLTTRLNDYTEKSFSVEDVFPVVLRCVWHQYQNWLSLKNT
ncbi:biotin--[acetyl-CoA-carboxylase] ligase [Candidatus Finniella inopinata]|uniref:Biotin--[acetyl-CoA-carboxylase] ligase n=1 Tax=Candidatus Finniella inopinata TaxID=1696036 RepID=A0A4Q7DIW9_9PROT|nr:biotin--[acetyl-CoA-carboxylase] ligase [Candidatus Finniella inopinata]RZI46682.1 biotin--[acetyl-CoA-carboxylase] ligase [Candidatus Finniella inopinata]